MAQLRTYLNFGDIISQIPNDAKFLFDDVVSMENLPMNNKGGSFSDQSYGYILYRIKASFSEPTTYWAGPVQNFAILIVDGVIKDTLDATAVRPEYWIDGQRGTLLAPKSGEEQTIDLLIENSGRHNVGGENEFKQQKGLPADYGGYISLNGVDQTEIETFALEFKSDWVKNLTNWKKIDSGQQLPLKAPCLIQATFEVIGSPTDAYLDVSAWHKGIVFINGFNIGRYFKVGPYRNLYVPAPLLLTGLNTITIFEQLEPGNSLSFSMSPYNSDDFTGAQMSQHAHSHLYLFFVGFSVSSFFFS